MGATHAKGARVLIGGHFTPSVRRDLFLVQAATRNTGKTLNSLLGEAINDLCAKYGVRCSPSSDQRYYRAAPASDHVSLEPKACEICGKSFLRVIGQSDKTCSGCEVRLTEEARMQQALLAAAKRVSLKSAGDRERRESLDPAPSRSPVPAQNVANLSRAARAPALTLVRNGRRRGATIAVMRKALG
jgi:hypothetical protein